MSRASSRPGAKLRAGLLILGALGLAGSGGCRCNKDTLAPVVFDDGANRAPIDANRVLVPPWRPPAVTQLDNGTLVHWLHEEGAQSFHVRVLLPTSIHADKLDAAGIDAALEALRLHLEARLRRIPATRLELTSRPGRIEIAVHGRDAEADRVLGALASSLAEAGNAKLLSVAQGKVLARHTQVAPSSEAAAALTTELLEIPLEHELAAKSDIVALSKGRLDRAWTTLTDPRDALVIVHSARPLPGSEAPSEARDEPAKEEAKVAGEPSEAEPEPEDTEDTERDPLAEALETLGARWKAPLLGFGSGKPAATVRLRGPEAKLRDRNTFLLTESRSAPLVVHEGKPEAGGRAIVVLGRIIPTPTPEDRMLARLCQRLMQERVDARLVTAGPLSVFAVRVRISPTDPVRSLKRIIERMQSFSAAEQTRGRLEQATNLWLGARVVDVSLQGEDWTTLWSQSIDLASEDREIYSALARDAQAMLEADPKQVQSFFATWMDPQGGEPGWTWVATGVDDNFSTKLGASLKLVEADE